MSPPVSSEHERIAALRRIFASPSTAVDVGIGDDAAILAHASGRVVVSVDAHVEGTHFTRALMSLEDAGFRATMAALSDLAAMGATPIAVFGALGLPKRLDDEELFAIAHGQAAAAALARTTIAGGNLTANPVISITTTVIGEAERPVRRSGARAGDAVLLGGDVGWSAAGLMLLRDDRVPAGSSGARAVAAFRRPPARIALGLAAAGAGVTSMIDVSDGLAADAGHVATESGLDVCLDLDALEDPALIALVGAEAAEAFVLGGGEDFALLATAPADAYVPGMRRVGACRPAEAEPAVYGARAGAAWRRITGAGFDHFR